MAGLLRVPLFDDELVTSFLSRTARANGSPGLKHFCFHLGLSHSGIVSGCSDATKQAEDVIVGVEGKLLERRISVADVRHVEFRGELFTNVQMRRVPCHICRECLIDDDARNERMPGTRRYARIAWTFQCLPVCVHHQTAMTRIPTTGRKGLFDFYQLMDCTSLAGGRNVQQTVANDFERYFEGRLRRNLNGACLLDEVELPACIVACENLGKAAMFGRFYQERRMGEVATRLALARGFEILGSGRPALDELLDGLCHLVDSRHADSGTAIYGTLYRALSRRTESRAFLASTVLKHAILRYPSIDLRNIFPELIS